MLSTGAKLRILREPFIPKRTGTGDESLADMVRRRLGPEPLAHLIDPMVAGIYAGDPETLSVRHAFPKLYQLEQDYGSFIRGAFAKKKAVPGARSSPSETAFRPSPTDSPIPSAAASTPPPAWNP